MVLWALLAAGCTTPDAPPPADRTSAEATSTAAGLGTAGIEIRDARAHLMSQVGAVYLSVVHPGGEDDRLVSAATPIAGAAELHESFEEDGVMRMRARPDGFVVPAGGGLELRPSGKHMMLTGLRVPGQGETTFPLILTFEKAGEVEVEVTIVPMGEMAR